MENKKRKTYTMMLLIGMCISLTKKPMKPMMANPIAVAKAIFWNSTTKINQLFNDSLVALYL
jgi:hypothetical protein